MKNFFFFFNKKGVFIPLKLSLLSQFQEDLDDLHQIPSPPIQNSPINQKKKKNLFKIHHI